MQPTRRRPATRLAVLLATAFVLIGCQDTDLDADTEPPAVAEQAEDAVDDGDDGDDADTWSNRPSERTGDDSFVEVLTTVHQLLGYLVALTVLAFAVVGFADRRDSAGGEKLFAVPAIAIDVQVLGGLLMYWLGGYWQHPSWAVRLLHPLLALSALAVAHVMLARARRHASAVSGRRTAATGLLVALVLVAAAIGVVSAGVRGVG